MKIRFTTILSLGALATALPGWLSATILYTDDFSQDNRDSYERVDIYQSPGESAWNIVDEEMRMVNQDGTTDGTTAFMHKDFMLSEVGDFAQIDFRFDDTGPGKGRAAGLYLNDTLGGIELSMLVQDGGVNRFQLGVDDFYNFSTDTSEQWTTLRVEIASISDSIATFDLSMSGRYTWTGSFEDSVGQHVGFVQYNGDGINISQDNFTLGTMTAVPEPATTAFLMGAGSIGLVLVMRRRRKEPVTAA